MNANRSAIAASSRSLLCGLIFAVTACDAGGPERPATREVTVTLENPHGIEVSASLRYAVVWVVQRGTEQGMEITDSGPVAGTSDEFQVSLELPRREVIDSLIPIERLQITPANPAALTVEAHRPRFIVFEDVDENQQFEPSVFGRRGPDRVLAADGSTEGIAAVLDLEAALRAVPMERAQYYFAATDGSFTPFVRVGVGAQLFLAPWWPNLSLELDGSGFPRVSLECFRALIGYTTVSRTLLIDSAIDPAMCGLSLPACTPTDLGALPAPELPSSVSSEFRSGAQCRRRESLEALVTLRTELVCTDCSCQEQGSQATYVADTSALPGWWPCGTLVSYCESDEPLTSFTIECDRDGGMP